MPLFRCPDCAEQYLVPLAFCEWLLDSLPPPQFDADGQPVYVRKCLRCMGTKVQVVEGDLLDQEVEVIVNAWNRNIIPWWLLVPHGVSGAIKRRGGIQPFKELARYGPMPLGSARLTSAGRLPFKGIIHVAGIDMFWRASERSIRDSVKNAVALAEEKGFASIAFPVIGAGAGGFDEERAKALMLDVFTHMKPPMVVKVVVFKNV